MRRTFPTLTGMTASGACAPSLREEHDSARPMREIGTRILRFTDYLFAFAVPVGSAFRAGDADWQARKNRSAFRQSCRRCRRRYSAAFDGASWSPAAPAGSRGQKVNRGKKFVNDAKFDEDVRIF